MTDLVKLIQQLPDKPTAADTANWYLLHDAGEKHCRHEKRKAVAAEYNSGRNNMAAWYREIDLKEQAGKDLLTDCRQLGLIGEVADRDVRPDTLSKAIPTRDAAREYAKAEPEVRVEIQKIIEEDPDKEIKAAEIRKLRAELAAVNEAMANQPEPIVDLDKHRAMTQGMNFGSVVDTFLESLHFYQVSSKDFLDSSVVARHDARLRELQAMLERYFNPTIQSISPTTIDV